jgi:hypothetical protein
LVGVHEFQAVLEALDFGQVDSESEQDLDAKFLRTQDFEAFVRTRKDLVRGPKGSGKSALFQLFARHEELAVQFAGSALDRVLLRTGTGLRDVQEVSTSDIAGLLRQEHLDVERVWISYLALKSAEAIADSEFRPGGELARFMRAAGLRTDRRLLPSLGRVWRRTISDTSPTAVKIQAFSHGLEVRGRKHPVEPREVLEQVHSLLVANGLRLWLLFDNLDELFPLERGKRAAVISGLFAVCNQVRGSFPTIEPKLFIRSDIWGDLHFTNKSHWVGKDLDLEWSEPQLRALLLKRAVTNGAVKEHLAQGLPALDSPQAVDELSEPEKVAALYAIFDSQFSEDGWSTWDWMRTRAKDGRFGALPREMITFGNVARAKQLGNHYPTKGGLISAAAVREAYPELSRLRCETFLTEFPELENHFRRFLGATTPRFHRAQLERLMSGLSPHGEEMLEALYEVGVIEPMGGEHFSVAREFEMPLLYRPGLGLRLRGRR